MHNKYLHSSPIYSSPHDSYVVDVTSSHGKFCDRIEKVPEKERDENAEDKQDDTSLSIQPYLSDNQFSQGTETNTFRTHINLHANSMTMSTQTNIIDNRFLQGTGTNTFRSHINLHANTILPDISEPMKEMSDSYIDLLELLVRMMKVKCKLTSNIMTYEFCSRACPFCGYCSWKQILLPQVRSRLEEG